jgi:hypothetical protein
VRAIVGLILISLLLGGPVLKPAHAEMSKPATAITMVASAGIATWLIVVPKSNQNRAAITVAASLFTIKAVYDLFVLLF